MGALALSPRFSCKIALFREPTSGLEPLTCSLRVITHALQGVAGGCKSRLSKRLSLLRLAACCTVLRSRWYQSGINFVLRSALDEQENQGSKTCASKFSLSMQVGDQQREDKGSAELLFAGSTG